MQYTSKRIHLPLFLVVLLQATSHVQSECEFSQYSYYHSGIFLQQFGEGYTMVNFQGNPIRIPDQGSMEAVCSSGFRFPGHPQIFGKIEGEPGRDYEEYTNVTITCQNGDMIYHLPGGLKQDVEENSLICKDNKARFYKANVANCGETGFLYGFMVKEVPVILAEVCYNIAEDKTLFVHFIGGKRSVVLENQTQHNPSLMSEHLHNFGKYVFPNHAEMQKSLDKIFVLPGYTYIAEYKLEYLAPMANYSSLIGNLADNFEYPNVIPMWTTLRNYNWRIFQDLLRKESMKESFEIYAGISGKVQYPYDLRCNSTTDFSVWEDTLEVNVPLHIWYYLTARGKPDVSTVVIAVNSPIVELGPSTVICTDVCDEISWLKPMSRSRKILSLGYIYCCKSQVVANLLKGFPVNEGTDSAAKSKNGAAPKSKM